jgi:hypothetical protein
MYVAERDGLAGRSGEVRGGEQAAPEARGRWPPLARHIRRYEKIIKSSAAKGFAADLPISAPNLRLRRSQLRRARRDDRLRQPAPAPAPAPSLAFEHVITRVVVVAWG